MVSINELRVGDKVKIVDKWREGCRQNFSGKMDHWLGEIMTVRKICFDATIPYVKMNEDAREFRNGWKWFAPAIQYIVYDEEINIDDYI